MKQNLHGKGISLIVLVITIIVMIILAGVIIISLTNDNIIAKAKFAKESSDFANIRAMVEMEKSNMIINGSTTYIPGNTPIPATYSQEIEVTTGGTIIIKETANTKISDLPNAIEKLGAVYIPAGFVVSTVAGEMSKEEGLVIKEGSNGASTTSNEFVWVPVESYSQFVREHFGTASHKTWSGTFVAASYATKTSNMLEVEPIADYIGSDATQLEVNAMYDSVKKYKGFYIARYEASNNGSGVVISQQGKTAWNSIEWGNSGTDSNGLAGIPNTTGAVGKSRAMYSASTSVKSTLVYGVQWDAIMRWYNSSGINVRDDSTSWENSTGSVVSTGADPKYKAKNIYDIAGNIKEWTMEASGSTLRVIRGGYYSMMFESAPASYRLDNTYPYGIDGELGFRPALYIK